MSDDAPPKERWILLFLPDGDQHQLALPEDGYVPERDNPEGIEHALPFVELSRSGDVKHEIWDRRRGWVPRDGHQRRRALEERRAANLTDLSREEYIHKVITALFPDLVITDEQMETLFPDLVLKREAE